MFYADCYLIATAAALPKTTMAWVVEVKGACPGYLTSVQSTLHNVDEVLRRQDRHHLISRRKNLPLAVFELQSGVMDTRI
jgi:hypothetical protein